MVSLIIIMNSSLLYITFYQAVYQDTQQTQQPSDQNNTDRVTELNCGVDDGSHPAGKLDWAVGTRLKSSL